MDWRAGYPDEFSFLDDEHEAIARKLEDLRKCESRGELASATPKMLALEVLRGLEKHMAVEESVMESTSYPEEELHKLFHESVLHTLDVILGFFDDKSMTAYRDSIVKHIENKLSEEILADRLFATFLKERQDRP